MHYTISSTKSLFCARAGQSITSQDSIISGDAYIAAQHNHSKSHIWRRFGVIVAFWIFFVILTILGFMWDYDSGGSGLIFKRGNGSRTGVKLFDEENVHNKDMEEQTPRGPPEENIAAPPANQSTLACRNLNYNVRQEAAEKQLQREDCRFAKPGQLSALMGTSGHGKTTLTEVR